VNTDPSDKPGWRDPLTLGFQAHRRLLLLRLRWHARRGIGERPGS
jgi:hypothetical protein